MDKAEVIRRLRDIVGDRFVLDKEMELQAYDCDAFTLIKHRPLCVVLPETTEQVAQVVRLLHEQQLPFLPRGAGTGLSGGAIPLHGEVIIGLSRMTRVLDVDVPAQRATVEAGLVNAWLTKRVEGDGYYYAPDPSSQMSCTLGGNVAENSGGPHCLKYGVTTNHVLGVTLVLPDGEIVKLGGQALDYPGYDLLGLLIGSEGTLGVVTEITVRLLRKPQGVKTVLCLFNSIAAASDTVSDVIAAGILPAALEIMDELAIKAVEKGNYAIGYPPDLPAVLIVEVDGLVAGLEEQAQAVVDIAKKHGCREVKVAQSAEERAAWWNNRKTAFGAMGKLAPDYYVQDGVIPRSKLTHVMARIAAISAEYDLLIANVFHAGDGNLHPLIAYDHTVPGMTDRVVQAGSAILKACVDAGGTISGEHGIGIEKREDMHACYTDLDLSAQVMVREVFNPADLCNPGKMIPTPGRCVEIKKLAKV